MLDHRLRNAIPTWKMPQNMIILTQTDWQEPLGLKMKWATLSDPNSGQHRMRSTEGFNPNLKQSPQTDPSASEGLTLLLMWHFWLESWQLFGDRFFQTSQLLKPTWKSFLDSRTVALLSFFYYVSVPQVSNTRLPWIPLNPDVKIVSQTTTPMLCVCKSGRRCKHNTQKSSRKTLQKMSDQVFFGRGDSHGHMWNQDKNNYFLARK